MSRERAGGQYQYWSSLETSSAARPVHLSCSWGRTPIFPRITPNQINNPYVTSVLATYPSMACKSSAVSSDAEEAFEHVINVPFICHRPHLQSWTSARISPYAKIDSILVGNFVTVSQAQRKWLKKVMSKVRIIWFELLPLELLAEGLVGLISLCGSRVRTRK